MSRYKEYMRSGWSGCRLLHQGVDPHRGRPAKYFAIPGEFSLIGYSDDTDTFVIPVSVYVPREATEALRAIQEGRSFAVAAAVVRRQRRAFKDDTAPMQEQSKRRRAFHD